MPKRQRGLFEPKVDRVWEKTIPVTVSEDVLVTKTELRIIDSEAFQRLRRLKQLGTSYLVYPSATHTRFEHSLGTLKAASGMIEMIHNSVERGKSAIDISVLDEQIIRLAALMHDITTIPFGHTLEDETTVITSSHDSEERYQRFFQYKENGEIEKALMNSLGEDRYKLLRRILCAKSDDIYSLGEKAYICDIVKNTVCADLLDYLKRDALHCGLRSDFGNRFLRFLQIIEVKNTDVQDVEMTTGSKPQIARRLATRLWKIKEKRHRRDLVDELIQLLSARFLLSSAVYFHHAKVITSAMIARAVKRALQQNIVTEDDILFKLGDDELLYVLEEKGTTEISELARDLKQRKLYKIFNGYGISREAAEAQETPINLLKYLEDRFNRDADYRTQIENTLAEDLKIPPGSILIYCPQKDMSLKEANMLVIWKGAPRPLRQIDDQLTKSKIDNIIGSHKKQWSLSIFLDPRTKSKIDTGLLRPHLLEDCCRYRIEGDEELSTTRLDAYIENVVVDVMKGRVPSPVMEEAHKFCRDSARKGKRITRETIEGIVDDLLDKGKQK